MVERGHVGAKQLTSIIGKIVPMTLALGPLAKLMTRNLYRSLGNFRVKKFFVLYDNLNHVKLRNTYIKNISCV